MLKKIHTQFNLKVSKNSISLLVFLFVCNLNAQLKQHIGNANFSDWSGISQVVTNEASFNSGATVSYRYPDGTSYHKGFRKYYAHASDWSVYKGVSFDIFLEHESTVDINVSFKVAEEDRERLNPISTATIKVNGAGWQSVYIPWDVFDLDKGQRIGTLQGVKTFEIVARSDKNKTLRIKNVFLTKGQIISLDAAIQGKSAHAGNQVEYELAVGNTTNKKQVVQLVFEKRGWESMQASVTPSSVAIDPDQIKKCKIKVVIPSSLPEGVREKQIIKAIPNGNGMAAISTEFSTAVALPYPNIVHTSQGWDHVRSKVEKYDWAKKELKQYEEKAIQWVVPSITTKKPPRNAHMGRYLFDTKEADKMFNCAITYQVTRKKEYAEKCALFLKRFSNPENGYPTTFRANPINFVKEGGFFQNIARAYDLIKDAQVLSEAEDRQIETSFRLFIETAQLENSAGNIGNWDLSEMAGALYCALILQDWHLIDELLHCATGIYQQFSQGVMSDGWWYECSVGYNLWCATMFSEIALALEPWGMNFKNQQLPLGTSPHFSLFPVRKKSGLYGMSFDKWGEKHKNSIGIKDMWDALIPFLDYRGIMFGVNDAREMKVTGKPYELAYYMYKDPEYAAVIRRENKRDLLYGVGDLPAATSKKVSQSAYADNIGIVQLRSQAKDRSQRDQIQAALHYGTHGGYHGHFDRTNFLSMMRYGRSFYNPEMIWYSYPPYMYKFLVQTSMTKNMVVVDHKMQEPKESKRTLFHTGTMMQATAVETTARWSYPPYGGMKYDSQGITSFQEKIWRDHASIEIPANIPEYGEVTGFTEPVLQRRLMIMMDDYIILSDYLKAEKEHDFDWLMQMKGFKEINAEKKKFIGHKGQMDTDPLGSAQFFTDCDSYQTEGTARTKFEMCWGEHCDNKGTLMLFNEEGPLKIDVFNAWPLKNEITLATPPENHAARKPLWYTIKADDKIVKKDSTGAWILGSKKIDLDIRDKKKLVLITKTKNPKNNTIFWGNARLVKKYGTEVFVSSLPVTYQNILLPTSQHLDYYGGPVKIAGELLENSTPGMPENHKEEGSITIDLSGLDAVSFKATLGGDFPMGDESSRRKTMAVHSKGKEARYVSVIEPYENKSAIKSVIAKSAEEIVVELYDGRIQEISISGLDTEHGKIKVTSRELVNGNLIRSENTL